MDSSPSANTAIFTCFRKLPIELRPSIWSWMLPGPRTVDINVAYNSNPYSRKKICTEPSPVVARVNQESREVCLKSYKCFDRGSLINYEIELIYFCLDICVPAYLNELCNKDISQIKSVAFHQNAFADQNAMVFHDSLYENWIERNFDATRLIYRFRHVRSIGLVLELRGPSSKRSGKVSKQKHKQLIPLKDVISRKVFNRLHGDREVKFKDILHELSFIIGMEV